MKRPQESLSLRAYARHRQVSAVAVLSAIRGGRLKDCLVRVKGKPKIKDVALADREWDANTDYSKAPGYVKEQAAKRQAGEGLAEASTREKTARAKLAELQYQQKTGALIDAKIAEDFHVDLVTRSRTKLLGLPNRVKAASPELTHAQILVIDRLLREALEELALLAKEGAA